VTNIDEYRNKIICGDCLEILPQLPEGSIDLIIFDPPYSRFSASDGLRTNLGDYKILEIFFKQLSFQLKRVIKRTGATFGFCDFRTYPSLFYGMYYNFCPTNLIVWKKNFPGPGVRFRPIHELIVYWKEDRAQPPKDRQITDIWEAPRVKNVDKLHPYMKPIELVEIMIHNCSGEGDTILDPFVGSGTTCLVAKMLGRNYIGIEINPEYCAVAEKRLAALPNMKLEAFT